VVVVMVVMVVLVVLVVLVVMVVAVMVVTIAQILYGRRGRNISMMPLHLVSGLSRWAGWSRMTTLAIIHMMVLSISPRRLAKRTISSALRARAKVRARTFIVTLRGGLVAAGVLA
jgi:hypothetical protein